ncbi:MAG: PEP-CTERM sorting domain-containing protein [Gammaproteobacteria bacterium]|jgi:hypothetical protein
MIKLSTIAAAAALSLGVAGTANAVPMLNIVDSSGALQTTTFDSSNSNIALNPEAEAIGDPGGTDYANGPTANASPGPGLPTATGNWPNASSFGMDAGGGLAPAYPTGCTVGVDCAMGISGYDESYLKLDTPGKVTFQFMGRGDASLTDLFQMSFDGGTTWNDVFNNHGSNGTCGVNGTTPDCPFAGSQVTYDLQIGAGLDSNGLIAFRFLNTSTGDVATNDGSNNPPDNFARYFTGIDPYLTSNRYDNTGRAAYVGFTDLPCTAGGACDHDYEDLVVRVSTVPEPGTIFLLGAGLLGVGVGRRKMATRIV